MADRSGEAVEYPADMFGIVRMRMGVRMVMVMSGFMCMCVSGFFHVHYSISFQQMRPAD